MNIQINKLGLVFHAIREGLLEKRHDGAVHLVMKRGAVEAFRIGRDLRYALGDDFRKRGEEGEMVCFWHNNFLWIGKVVVLLQQANHSGDVELRLENIFHLRPEEQQLRRWQRFQSRIGKGRGEEIGDHGRTKPAVMKTLRRPCRVRVSHGSDVCGLVR